jgi:2-polyprenyl-3-methyl-5-hydroxy-6-metoxy-1,4-benzoquinol methylase
MSTEFNTEQFNNAYADGIENSYWQIARKKLVLRILHKYKLNNILDVGCGRGIVIAYLYKAGLNITGVDLGSPVKQDSVDVKIFYNTNAVDLPESFKETVETITMFDVIEHIEQPVDFINSLDEAYPNLKNLVITVPARKELWTNFDDAYGHFRRYTIKSLKQEINQTNFEIIYSRYIFHILYFLIRINNLIVKQRELIFKPPKNSFSIFINKFMGTLFYKESIVLPGKLFGSSVLCICKKKSSK